jgi:hypothetical protein
MEEMLAKKRTKTKVEKPKREPRRKTDDYVRECERALGLPPQTKDGGRMEALLKITREKNRSSKNSPEKRGESIRRL